MKKTLAKIIGTHNGVFHADEVTAIAILKLLYPNAEVIRTRDEESLSKCDIVVDVGGGELDHHGLDVENRDNGMPYASAGLVWKKYGSQLIKEMSSWLSDEQISSVLNMVDKNFMIAIDALDNGVDLYKSDYHLTTFSSIISSYNPSWNETHINPETAFNNAISFATDILLKEINKSISSFEIVNLIQKDLKLREIPEILVLSKIYPWKKALLESEIGKDVLFVVFKDVVSDSYRVQTVPKTLESKEARKNLPETWMGLRGEDLNIVTGVSDAIFCHKGRFIAGTKSLESSIKFAKLALGK